MYRYLSIAAVVLSAGYEHINPVGINAPILISQKGTIFTVQRINIILKEVKKKYRLKIKNFSCHSLRKTFGHPEDSLCQPIVQRRRKLESFKDVSDDPEKMKLQFYPAFGGINGSIGAKYEFDLPLSPECKEIYVLLYDDYKLLIAKNPATGEWDMV